MKNYFLGQSFIDYVLDGIDTKYKMIQKSTFRYLLGAIMAGILVTFGYIIIMKMNDVFADPNIATITGSILFSFALISIYYTKSELLTSNMMMTTVGVYYKKIPISRMLKILLLCYIGNLLGGVVVGLLLAPSTTINEGMVHYLQHAIELKQGYIANGAYFDLLSRAIFANFFINVAMLMVYSGNIKNDVAKIIIMMYGIFMFINLGFEHSVANTDLFIFGAFYQLFHPSVEVGLNAGLATMNVVVALIGNYIGGGLMIGLYYSYMYDNSKIK